MSRLCQRRSPCLGPAPGQLIGGLVGFRSAARGFVDGFELTASDRPIVGTKSIPDGGLASTLMEIHFDVHGKDEADLKAAAKNVMVRFVDVAISGWKWSITATAEVDDNKAVTGWLGKVKATNEATVDGSGDE